MYTQRQRHFFNEHPRIWNGAGIDLCPGRRWFRESKGKKTISKNTNMINVSVIIRSINLRWEWIDNIKRHTTQIRDFRPLTFVCAETNFVWRHLNLRLNRCIAICAASRQTPQRLNDDETFLHKLAAWHCCPNLLIKFRSSYCPGEIQQSSSDLTYTKNSPPTDIVVVVDHKVFSCWCGKSMARSKVHELWSKWILISQKIKSQRESLSGQWWS